MARVFHQIITEFFLMFLYPLFSILVHFVPKKALVGNKHGRTIVIVERWLSMNIKHVFWKYYLEKKGFDVHLVNLPLRKGSFDNSAHDLKRYIEKNSLDDVILIGISSGALSSLVYLQEYGGWDRVEKFISVGAPFRGTNMAAFLSYCYSGRELLPNSKFVKKISSYKILNPEKIVCIRAKLDEMVPKGSVLPGTKEVVMNVVGHNNLHIQVRSTYRKIMEYAKP